MLESIDDFKARVERAVSFLEGCLLEKPQIVLMLGTGLSAVADLITEPLTIPYKNIPGFPQSTVTSHAGNLVCGRLGGKAVAVLQGRFHFYEGYATRELTLPIRVLSLLGAETFVVSNAAGGLNPGFSSGTLMIIQDHLNFIPDNPLRGPNVDDWGPRFPDLSKTYDQALQEKTLTCALRLGLEHVRSGVYCAIPGPSLETPAETRYLRNCGADAVGMSTVPEVIVARHAGMKVLGISVVSNVNDPDNLQPIILEDIIAQTEKAAVNFERLLVEILKEI
ncbi:MAG: purine-nucleoside phosphorylase [Proteobacteria bacterium]|nr:purine-nucleoside phosphorylase [Pseudomonadota bacterium]MBU1716344.1 purine-nucleoside phosphorylase [Pseudomonadota bacterium]